MKYGIVYAGLESLHTGPNAIAEPGMWLAHYDPDYEAGRGMAYWTWKPDEALKFSSVADAMALWKKPSRVKPWRSDGQPNRPLSACSVTIQRISE